MPIHDTMQELVDQDSFADEVEQIDKDLQVGVINDETKPQEETLDQKWQRLKKIMTEEEEKDE